ncbi:NAD-binding protein [Streptomyces sp. NPDC002144]
MFASFSRHVVHLGEAGAGQTAKLFNNALLMMNQAAIAEIVDLAAQLGMNPARLVDVLSSAAPPVPLTLRRYQ